MQQKKYTFPVIADWVLIRKLFAQAEPHRQALIDPEGRLSYPIRSWSLGRFLFEIERLAAGN